MEILGVIPARGGSKSIPKKYLADLAGKPLLAYTAECALKSRLLTRVMLSTDDEEIRKVGLEFGIDAPFLRPAELSGDEVLIAPVLQHLLSWLEEKQGYHPDILVLLQPTSPFRLPEHIDDAVELFIEKDAESVVSVVEVPHRFTPVSLMQVLDGRLTSIFPDQANILRRQDKPLLYARNGPAVLILRPELVMRGVLYSDRTYAYPMGTIYSMVIDQQADLQIANYIFPLWMEYQERDRREGSGTADLLL